MLNTLTNEPRQYQLLPVPNDFVLLKRDEEMFSQSDINFMLNGTKQSIKDGYAAKRHLKMVSSSLWDKCDKANPETSDTYKDYKKVRGLIKSLNKDLARMERISRVLKQMRKMA